MSNIIQCDRCKKQVLVRNWDTAKEHFRFLSFAETEGDIHRNPYHICLECVDEVYKWLATDKRGIQSMLVACERSLENHAPDAFKAYLKWAKEEGLRG